MKMILKWVKYERRKEKEDDSLLQGLNKIMFDLSEQNIGNIKKVAASKVQQF